MDLSFGPEYDDFRSDVVNFLNNNSDKAPKGGDLRGEQAKDWQKLLIENGYTCRTIPKEYGGFGAEPDIIKSRIIGEEFSKSRINPGLGGQGISMLVPTLLEMGTEEQKQKFIRPTIHGDMIWCQGYSEPGSGSDLAGLQTKAEDQGDYYLVNGSKIWTSYADEADWIFCLVRTDGEAAKHDGISFLLFDMESEGVTTSPIKLVSGSSPFCQTFFDNVKVPKAHLVGELNKGWTIAKRLLQHERQMISGIGGNSAAGGTGTRLEDVAKDYIGVENGKISDPFVRTDVTNHRMNDKAFQLTMARAGEEAKAGNADGNLASIFKYYGTEQNKRKYERMLEMMGTQSVGWTGTTFSEKEIGTTRQWLRSKANSIEGGTSEVQLNVISKRVLGLPD